MQNSDISSDSDSETGSQYIDINLNEWGDSDGDLEDSNDLTKDL